ncbi:MAG: aminopeptidase P family protein [Thermomicrobiales bacterium]|nr:aminopeptidase P family protein [Thermomicrobiales bacterium]
MASGGTSLSVYSDRIQRAQAELAARGIDFLFVGPSSDLFYLFGFDAHLSERLNLLIIPKEGAPTYVVPVLESFRVQDRSSLATIAAWEETDKPSDLVAKVIGDAANKRVAVSDTLWSVFLLRLQDALPGASWSSAVDVMRALRVSKDSYEVEMMREVSKRTDEAWHEFIEGGPISGLTETQTMERLQQSMAKRGLKGGFGICASGPNSASPHHHTGDRVIQPGDVVIFDWGGTLEGYKSDITRTVFVGEPTDEFRKVYEIVSRANQATFETVKPGVACQELDRAARKVITDAGYGPQFLHRVGHGLGLDVHEEPYLVEGNAMPLAEGMIFSDEPGIYLEGKFGVRIEDAVVCTKDGGERLNNASREITVMD